MNNNLLNLIGNTPLIKLNQASKKTKCEIYGKAEFLNPCGSVKDRPASYIIKSAIEKKHIKNKGTFVEGTAGNMGIGLSLIANSLGYQSIIVIPENQSDEKILLLKSCGSKVITVKPTRYSDENHFVKFSKKIAEKMNKKEKNSAYWVNQFDNVLNRKAHIETTGPEIWKQTDGEIDAFGAAVGSGGTINGVSSFLRKKNPKIKIFLPDPPGAGLYNFFKNGILKAEGNSITEGIGQNRITKNLENLKVDYPFHISDQETLDTMFELIFNEGLFVGTSSGINVAGAIRLAKELGPGHKIVTILCDSGTRYLTKHFNEGFLKSKNLRIPLIKKN